MKQDPGVVEDMKAFRVRHKSAATVHDAQCVIKLALLGLNHLLGAFLTGKSITNLLETEVTVELKATHGVGYLIHESPGNIGKCGHLMLRRTVTGSLFSALEGYRQYLYCTHGYTDDPVANLTKVLDTQFTGTVPVTELLIYFLAEGFDKEDRPWFPKSLRLRDPAILHSLFGHGADPNAADYAMTPLQLAVERRDTVAVRALLEREADPNRIGIVGGKLTKSISRRWCQASPLRIIRQAPHPLEDVYQDIALVKLRELDQMTKGMIERWLLERGARDFEQTDATQEEVDIPAKLSSEHMENVSEGMA
jgi:hypothetical protein